MTTPEDVLQAEFDKTRKRLEAFRMQTRYDRGLFLLGNRWDQRKVAVLGRTWTYWVSFVKAANKEAMDRDAFQWTLHANANRRRDLQAWYHSTFASELYRLRGAFWWKEAILPDYASHAIRLEERDPADKVLCSPNTIYTAMAATMYTIRSTLAEAEYDLFEKLTTSGVTVLKHPFRSGRPTKKRFQLSLVQGDMYLFMYLTWKGKRASIQGIELASVAQVAHGMETEVLRRTGKADKADCYLSLVTSDRSLDLCFETPVDRELWESTLESLVTIEQDVRRAANASDDPNAPPPPPPPGGGGGLNTGDD